MMKRLALLAASLLGACICEPAHHTETAFAPAAQFDKEIGECGANPRHCAPLCAAVFDLAADQIEGCKLGTFDATGAWVTAHWIDDGVCSSDDGSYEDGSWDDSGDDGTWDDGGDTSGSDDGSDTTDDGSGSGSDGSNSTSSGSDDGSTDDPPPDDGGTSDDPPPDDGSDWKQHRASRDAISVDRSARAGLR